jgi:Ras-related protein Rab-7L1
LKVNSNVIISVAQIYIKVLFHYTGPELFTWMTHVYYKDSHGCVIMFDLSNRSTLNNAIKWKKEVDSNYTAPEEKKFPCILIANKVCTEPVT